MSIFVKIDDIIIDRFRFLIKKQWKGDVGLKKQHIILLSFVFLFFYSLNSLMPMMSGDDYFYTFVYNGQSMFKSLPLEWSVRK